MSSYAELGFEVIDGLLTRKRAAEFLESISYLPERRVYAQKSADHFGSQDIVQYHPLHYFLIGPGLAESRRVCGDFRPLVEAQCWTSIYRKGERISPHRDVAGDTQFLVVLERPDDACRGALHIIDRQREEHVLRLAVGDALVFHANALTHFTEVLQATPQVPEPKRVVAVARFFFETN